MSNNGSKISIDESRHSLPGHKDSTLLPEIPVDGGDKLLKELLEERNKCVRLKECLEVEREKSSRITESSEAEVHEILNQLQEKDMELLEAGRRIEKLEVEKSQVYRELDQTKAKLEKYIIEVKATDSSQSRKRTPEKDGTLFENFYIEDLESKLEAYRIREDELQQEINELKNSL